MSDTAFQYSIDQAQRLFGKGLEVFGKRGGITTLEEYGRALVEKQDQDIREGNYQPEYTMGLREAYQQGGLSDAVGWIAEKTGENIATSGVAIGGGLAAALTAPFSVPAAALLGGTTILTNIAMSTGEVADEMEQKTGSYNEAVAIGAGTIMSILDRFGAGKVIPKDELLSITGKQLIKRLGEAGKVSAAKEIGKRIGKSVAFEGATEGLQEGVVMGSTALTGGEYTGEQIADRLLEGVVLGGTMGGTVTTGIETLRQGPGVVDLVGDIFKNGSMNPSQQFAIQLAGNLSNLPMKVDDVPPTSAEILLNEIKGGGTGGGDPRTFAEKVEDNQDVKSENDTNLDEDQFFFSPELTGPSVGNELAQKEADDEKEEIKQKAMRDTDELLSKDDGYIGSDLEKQKGIMPANISSSVGPREMVMEGYLKKGLKAAKNKERNRGDANVVVSPLRIKLVKFANKVGIKTPIKVSDLYEDLLAQDSQRDGSVGFLARPTVDFVEAKEIRYKPKDDLTPEQKKQFGELIRNAPKLRTPILDDKGKPILDKKGNTKVRETPDFSKIPEIEELGVKIEVPTKIRKVESRFDNEAQSLERITHNKGGEAFMSGLEEYLARNYNETKTMQEILHEFDRMRPNVTFEVRSDLNRNVAAPPFTVSPLSQGEIMANPGLAQGLVTPELQNTLQTTQRIFNSFATANGDPLYPENDQSVLNNRGQSPAAGMPTGKKAIIDSIAIVAKNPDQDRVDAGVLTNSPIIKAYSQRTDVGSGNKTIEEKLKDQGFGNQLSLPHDYYNKGFAYTRASVVEGLDDKLYAILEETQTDVTRTMENLLDFSKPEYDIALPLGGVPKLLSGAIDSALDGNDPYLTKKAALLGGTSFSDKRPVKNLRRTRDSLEKHNFLSPSEKNKIHVLDQMDADMPDKDAPSQFATDIEVRRKKMEEAKKTMDYVDKEITGINKQIQNFTLSTVAPQEATKFASMGLKDLKTFQKFIVPRMEKVFKTLRKKEQNFLQPLATPMPSNVAGTLPPGSRTRPRQFSFRQEIDPDQTLFAFDEMVERTLWSDADYGAFASEMAEAIENEVKDKTGEEFFDPDDLRDEGVITSAEAFVLKRYDEPYRLAKKSRAGFDDPLNPAVAGFGDMGFPTDGVPRDFFGREIIREFYGTANNTAGELGGRNNDGAVSDVKFTDRYRMLDPGPTSTQIFTDQGVVALKKFLSGSKMLDKLNEMGFKSQNDHQQKMNTITAPDDIHLYERNKDVFGLIMKHMPFASKDAFDLSNSGVPGLSESRQYTARSKTYNHGRTEKELLMTNFYNPGESFDTDPVERIRDDAISILRYMTDGSRPGVRPEDVRDYDARDLKKGFGGLYGINETSRSSFYGNVLPTDIDKARDAFEMAFNLAVKDAMHEAINEKALDFVKHKTASELVRKHKKALERIDTRRIIEENIDMTGLDSELSLYNKDIDPLSDASYPIKASPSSVFFEKVTQQIKDSMPATVLKDAEKFLSDAIDEVTDEIGFVPEDGSYREYMDRLMKDTRHTVGEMVLEKYSKQLGLDNPDKLKKKLLMNSILNRQKQGISPVSLKIDGLKEELKKSLSVLEKFKYKNDEVARRFFQIRERLKPMPFEDGDHNYSSDTDPTVGNFYQLFTTQAYRGYMQGDKERADSLQKRADQLVYKRGEAKKIFEENEVGEDHNKEIERRFKKLNDFIEDHAKDYNYSPEELKEAAQRLINHLTSAVRGGYNVYTRYPHTGTMTQAARGMMHGLIHNLTDPRFERLYGKPISGIIFPHRLDLYHPRFLEDGSLRNESTKRTFGMGTYGTVLQDIMERFERAGAGVDRDRVFTFKNFNDPNFNRLSLRRPVQGVIDLSPGSAGRRLAEGKFTFRAKGGYIDLRRKAG